MANGEDIMRILLCCAVGMSTSLLVRKMKKYAESNSINCTIWAIPAEAIHHHMDKADVILLGPQVRFLLRDVTNAASKREFLYRSLTQWIMEHLMQRKY